MKFVVCQEQELTKNEYHNLLGEAKTSVLVLTYKKHLVLVGTKEH